jgi:hypothetical protein
MDGGGGGERGGAREYHGVVGEQGGRESTIGLLHHHINITITITTGGEGKEGERESTIGLL